MILDDKRHLELGVLLQLIELPGMEVGDEIAILLQHTAHHPMVETFGQIMQGEPEEWKADERRNGCRYLHHPILHKPSARLREVHIAPRDKGWV